MFILLKETKNAKDEDDEDEDGDDDDDDDDKTKRGWIRILSKQNKSIFQWTITTTGHQHHQYLNTIDVKFWSQGREKKIYNQIEYN